jgi:type II secretory pathway pseudopilin PulG
LFRFDRLQTIKKRLRSPVVGVDQAGVDNKEHSVNRAPAPTTSAPAASCRGIGLVELLIALLVLAVAVLGYASLVLGQHAASVSTETEGRTVQVVRDLMERLRALDDWPTVYDRLCAWEDQAQVAADPSTRLSDGRFALTPATCFPGFTPPPAATDLRILIEVPRFSPATSGIGGRSWALREDVADGRFGLPADLNGDGVTDSDPRGGDYVVLPVHVRFMWRGPRGGIEERRIRTWLRGDR